jgi:ComF family protein
VRHVRLAMCFIPRVADAILAVALAPQCAACQQPLERPLAGPVCQSCWSSIRWLTPPLCEACGDPLPSWRSFSRESTLCPRCRRRPRSIDRGASLGEYAGSLRAIVHAFKYDGRRSLAPRLAALMRESAAELIGGADLAVPVPLHPRRLRSRGFNQAADLARNLGLPVLSALVRTRATTPQIELPASRRHRNVQGAFALAGLRGLRKMGQSATRSRLLEACVLLVDDVSTTGATLEACARVLKSAGAREVRTVTVARVVGLRR